MARDSVLQIRLHSHELESLRVEAECAKTTLAHWSRMKLLSGVHSLPVEAVDIPSPPVPASVSLGVVPAVRQTFADRVFVDRDDGVVVVLLDGEDVGWEGEPTLMRLRREGVESGLCAYIQEKVRNLD